MKIGRDWSSPLHSGSLALTSFPLRSQTLPCFPEFPVGRLTLLACRDAPAPAAALARSSHTASRNVRRWKEPSKNRPEKQLFCNLNIMFNVTFDSIVSAPNWITAIAVIIFGIVGRIAAIWFAYRSPQAIQSKIEKNVIVLEFHLSLLSSLSGTKHSPAIFAAIMMK